MDDLDVVKSIETIGNGPNSVGHVESLFPVEQDPAYLPHLLALLNEIERVKPVDLTEAEHLKNREELHFRLLNAFVRADSDHRVYELIGFVSSTKYKVSLFMTACLLKNSASNKIFEAYEFGNELEQEIQGQYLSIDPYDKDVKAKQKDCNDLLLQVSVAKVIAGIDIYTSVDKLVDLMSTEKVSDSIWLKHMIHALVSRNELHYARKFTGRNSVAHDAIALIDYLSNNKTIERSRRKALARQAVSLIMSTQIKESFLEVLPILGVTKVIRKNSITIGDDEKSRSENDKTLKKISKNAVGLIKKQVLDQVREFLTMPRATTQLLELTEERELETRHMQSAVEGVVRNLGLGVKLRGSAHLEGNEDQLAELFDMTLERYARLAEGVDVREFYPMLVNLAKMGTRLVAVGQPVTDYTTKLSGKLGQFEDSTIGLPSSRRQYESMDFPKRRDYENDIRQKLHDVINTLSTTNNVITERYVINFLLELCGRSPLDLSEDNKRLHEMLRSCDRRLAHPIMSAIYGPNFRSA